MVARHRDDGARDTEMCYAEIAEARGLPAHEGGLSMTDHASRKGAATHTRSVFTSSTGEEERYFKMIDHAMERKRNTVISNGKPAHAVYLIYTFLKNANQSVKIYTGRLMQEFSGVKAYADPKIAEAAIRFLRKENSILSIVIVGEADLASDQTIRNHPLVAAICNADIRGMLTVSKGSRSDWENLKNHFMVMDETAARVEVDTDKAEAYVNFGDERFARLVSSVFDSFEERSERLLQFPNLQAAV